MEIEEQIRKLKAMINSYKLTYLIISANEIGIWECLSRQSKKLSQIAKEAGIEECRLAPILNALTSHKIISKDKNGYYLDEYDKVLNKNSEYNQLGYIHFAQTMMRKYQNLANAVKDKKFAINHFQELTEKGAESFMKGMEANAIPQAEFIANNYDFENHSILDVGAGAGTYLITIAKKDKTVTGKMIDLPEMVKIQNKKIEKEELRLQITAEECNYNEKFSTEKYDDVFLFAVVHQESKENVNQLLKNIYHVLKPEGRIFLTSFFLNEDKISPEFSVQFAVEMLMNSNNGRVYTHSEIQDLMVQNKFKEIRRIDDIPSPATLYVAKKSI